MRRRKEKVGEQKLKKKNISYDSAFWLFVIFCISHHLLHKEVPKMRGENYTYLWVEG